MPYFRLKPTKQTAACDDFLDRQILPSGVQVSPSLAVLAKRLSDYWQGGGLEILPLTDGDNELLTGQVLAKAQAYHQALLTCLPKPDACVLVAISDEEVPRLLLTRRASGLNSHAGEVSLVGGKRDEGDASSWAVAVREAAEEVGLVAKALTPLGYLPMQLSKNGLLVRPVVAQVAATVMDDLVANADEIDQMFWLPLADLQKPPVDWVFERVIDGHTHRLHTPAWCSVQNGQKQVVWGLTGRILANLMAIGFKIHHPWYYRLR